MLQNWSYNFHSNCWITFWTLTNRVLRFVTLDYTRKNRPNYFLTGKIAFFQKFVFNNLWDSQNFVLITSAVIVRLPPGPLKSVPWGLSYSIKREKGQNLFFTGKIAFFSKQCVFEQPLRCYRIDPITSTVIVGLPFGPLPIVFWGFSHSILREKAGQTFITGQKVFFEKFGSRILGPKETII